MPVTGQYFARYGAAFSCRFGAVFSCRFGAAFSCPLWAAKRQNGRAGALPANKGRGLPGEEIFSCRFAAVFSCPFRGGIFMPFRGGIFMPFCGGIFMPVTGQYFARYGAAFSCPLWAAKRQNGRAGVPPASKGRGLPKEAGFSSAASPASKGRGRSVERTGFPGAAVRLPYTRGRGCRGRGDILMPLRGGETAKRPRRCAARKQGARAAGGGDMIFRAASPASGPLSAKKAKKSRKIALHSFDIS